MSENDEKKKRVDPLPPLKISKVSSLMRGGELSSRLLDTLTFKYQNPYQVFFNFTNSYSHLFNKIHIHQMHKYSSPHIYLFTHSLKLLCILT